MDKQKLKLSHECAPFSMSTHSSKSLPHSAFKNSI